MKFYWLSGATFYDCINTIDQFIKLDKKKYLFLRNNEPLSTNNGCFDANITRISLNYHFTRNRSFLTLQVAFMLYVIMILAFVFFWLL